MFLVFFLLYWTAQFFLIDPLLVVGGVSCTDTSNVFNHSLLLMWNVDPWIGIVSTSNRAVRYDWSGLLCGTSVHVINWIIERDCETMCVSKTEMKRLAEHIARLFFIQTMMHMFRLWRCSYRRYLIVQLRWDTFKKRERVVGWNRFVSSVDDVFLLLWFPFFSWGLTVSFSSS